MVQRHTILQLQRAVRRHLEAGIRHRVAVAVALVRVRHTEAADHRTRRVLGQRRARQRHIRRHLVHIAHIQREALGYLW